MPHPSELARAQSLISQATEIVNSSVAISEEEFARLAEAYHQLLRTLKHKAYQDHPPDRAIDWLEQSYVPQSMQFMIDVLPFIDELLLQHFRRSDIISFLDVGPGSASGANLIATLHRSTALWAAMKVDAIDVLRSRQRYASLVYPDVNLEIGDITKLRDGRQWDIVYCSHTIEHVPDPALFLRHLVQRSKRYTIVYAPYDEQQLIKGHSNRITEANFEAYNPLLLKKFRSLGWHPTRGDLCILAVIDAREHRHAGGALF
jgi:SAM-dependent methyltransferase